MLPPREVPDNLSAVEYQKLLLRYQCLGWLRPLTRVSKILATHESSSNSEEGKRKMNALMTALEASAFVAEAVNSVQGTVSEAAKIAAHEGGKLLDKNELTRAAKDKVTTAFAFVGELANSAFNTVAENVLPKVGLPLDYIPDGGSQAQYILMARRYEVIGYGEQMRGALKKAVEVGGSDTDKAKLWLRIRVPRMKVPEKASFGYMNALRVRVSSSQDQSCQQFEALVRDYPDFEWPYLQVARVLFFRGDVERAEDLVKKVLKINPDFFKAWLMITQFDLAHWRINDLEQHISKLQSLDPRAPELTAIVEIYEFINQNGLR